MMFGPSVPSLQNCCVSFICENISALCETHGSGDDPGKQLRLRNSEVYFHGNISERILETLSEKGNLNDETLSFFDPDVTCLRKVCIKDAPVSTRGLRVLKSHKISELEVIGLKNVTVNDLIGCLGEWTLSNLRSLNVSNSTFINSSKFCVIVSLTKLRNLQSLNVSNTEFNRHGLDIIAEDLPNLEKLDISGTLINDISPLRKLKDRLRSLSMYNLRASHTEEVVPVLCELTKLCQLDVSDDMSMQPFVNFQPVKFRIRDLLMRECDLPELRSLDISGKEGLKEDLLRAYVVSHPKLQFLGLALTNACEWPLFADQLCPTFGREILVTGEANERQILESLRRYPGRSAYVQKALFNLFTLTHGMVEPREDIIELIVTGMGQHPKQLSVQMAATACLYNLSKGESGLRVHPSCLRRVVDLTLLAMENFPNHQQLQKNALLTLCSDRILQDVNFDRFRCAKLVMECLCSFDDLSMSRMAVAICSILAAKISTEQTSILGAKGRYMKKLLKIVEDKIHASSIDMTLKFTLSALWNLTDESPPTCHMFLSEGGLELFIHVLQKVHDLEEDPRVHVQTKVLGLVNNIAEVKTLRQALMREDFIMLAKRLLKVQDIDVSYFAAGIIAHLASDGEQAWLIAGTDREDILRDLGETVREWQQPQGEMVAYRSFSPFFPLLNCYDMPSVQLWASWAIQHVVTRNGKRYCPMLVKEGGVELLRQMVANPKTEATVVTTLTNILSLLKEHVRDFQ
ncbi:protein zyg-11 homolog B-like [Liolophura sinensis]|uniref:protein zyg-11 homolog B-like n=1 Tax=Liolophura sinensis TaxID=3198878 RepID=UPI0031596555